MIVSGVMGIAQDAVRDAGGLSVFAVAVIGAVFIATMLIMSANRNAKVATHGIPGSLGSLPLVGDTFTFIKDVQAYLDTQHARYGDIFRTVLPGGKTVVIRGGPLAQAVLNTQRDHAVLPGPAQIFGGASILTSNGKIHKLLRSIALGAFGPNKLESFKRGIFTQTRIALEKLDRRDYIDGNHALNELALLNSFVSLVGENPLPGLSYDELVVLLGEYSAGVMSLPINLPFTGFGKGMRARQRLIKAIQVEVQRRRSLGLGEKLKEKHDDVLTALMCGKDPETGQCLTDTYITDNAVLFLFASQDTTGFTMTQTMVVLKDHPDIKEKVRQEVLGVGRDIEELSVKELKAALPYTQAVVKEALRLQASVGFTLRTMKDDLKVNSNGTTYVIPKGWSCVISIAQTIKSCANFKNASKVDPDRFLGDRTEDLKNKESFIPFSTGQRSCPGQHLAMLESMIFAALLCTKYEIEFERPVEWEYTFGPRPKGGIPMRLKPITF